jgi:hypothetical protein
MLSCVLLVETGQWKGMCGFKIVTDPTNENPKCDT